MCGHGISELLNACSGHDRVVMAMHICDTPVTTGDRVLHQIVIDECDLTSQFFRPSFECIYNQDKKRDA